MLQTISNLQDELRRILDEVITNTVYETEYDGRMYTFCMYCDGKEGEHESNCVHLTAQKVKDELFLNDTVRTLREQAHQRMVEVQRTTRRNAHERRKLSKWQQDRLLQSVSCMLCHEQMSSTGFDGHYGATKCCNGQRKLLGHVIFKKDEEIKRLSCRGAKQVQTCECGCGRKFEARVADIKRGWGKFYSKSCASKML